MQEESDVNMIHLHVFDAKNAHANKFENGRKNDKNG